MKKEWGVKSEEWGYGDSAAVVVSSLSTLHSAVKISFQKKGGVLGLW
ncbi:MAG: hypothetical protein FWC57_02310 [Endomicrobia bacterium]|nr:hypothetical protein [Endomicrobiia bacterium]